MAARLTVYLIDNRSTDFDLLNKLTFNIENRWVTQKVLYLLYLYLHIFSILHNHAIVNLFEIEFTFFSAEDLTCVTRYT